MITLITIMNPKKNRGSLFWCETTHHHPRPVPTGPGCRSQVPGAPAAKWTKNWVPWRHLRSVVPGNDTDTFGTTGDFT